MSASASTSVADLFLQLREAGFGTAEGRAAGEALIRRIGPEVLALCRRRVNKPEAAEDLFQETFLQLFLQARKNVVPTSLGSYIAGIVRHLAMARWRERRSDEELVETSDPRAPSEQQIVNRIDLMNQLSILPERLRRVLEAQLEGRSAATVAAELGTSEENVRQLRARAVRILASSQGKKDRAGEGP